MEEVPSLEPPQGMDWMSLLPEDVERMVLGFLDLPTLYTARLVCKRFRKFGAGHFKALDCPTLEGLLTTDLAQFSGMKHLAVTVSRESHLQSLADPRIAPVVTHVLLKGFCLRNNLTAEGFEGVLMRLPELRSVSLHPSGDYSRLPSFPSRLEELKITDRYSNGQGRVLGCVGDASSLTQYSRLTSLVIDLGPTTLMETLSSLRNLRSLDIRSRSSALGFLSTLTALTCLTFEQRFHRDDGSVYQELGRLAGLSQLALSCIMTPEGVTHEDLTCIAQLNSLTCLDMRSCRFADSAAASTALVRLTGLVAVGFRYPGCMPQLSVPQAEALHSLTLHHAYDASLLLRASRLTHLDVITGWGPIDRPPPIPRGALCPAVATMSRLRSLTLNPGDYHLADSDDWPVFRLDTVLQACTMLTKLDSADGVFRPDRDLKACAALPGLCSLSLQQVPQLTRAWLPMLQAMSGLSELSLIYAGICPADMTPDVVAEFDAKRHELGWPLLKLRVEDWRGRRFERLGH